MIETASWRDLVIGLDPGPASSATVMLSGGAGGVIVEADYWKNEELLNEMRRYRGRSHGPGTRRLVIEDVEHRGLPVGRDVFTMLKWCGRFEEAGQWIYDEVEYLLPSRIRAALCGTVRVKDAEIKSRLIGLWSGERAALGSVKCSVCRGRGWRGRGRPTCEECSGSGWEVEPGPLRSIQDNPNRQHLWRALAVAVVAADSVDREARVNI